MKRLSTIVAFCCAFAVLRIPAVAQAAHYSVLCNVVQRAEPKDKKSAAVKINVAVEERPVTRVSLAQAQGPRRVFILRDSSGSMKEGNADRLAWEAVKYFVASSPPTDQLALVDFSNEVCLDIPLQSASLFSAALNKPELTKEAKPSGGTAVYDSIGASLEHLLKNSPQEGASIFVISDGGDNASSMNSKTLREKLRGTGVRVFLLMLERPQYRRPEQTGQRDLLPSLKKAAESPLAYRP